MKMCLVKMDDMETLDLATAFAYEMKLNDFTFHGKHYLLFDGKYREESE